FQPRRLESYPPAQAEVNPSRHPVPGSLQPPRKDTVGLQVVSVGRIANPSGRIGNPSYRNNPSHLWIFHFPAADCLSAGHPVASQAIRTGRPREAQQIVKDPCNNPGSTAASTDPGTTSSGLTEGVKRHSPEAWLRLAHLDHPPAYRRAP